MKKTQRVILLIMLLAVAVAAGSSLPVDAKVSEGIEMHYQPVPDFFKLPANFALGEVPGVAMDSLGHIFIFHRGENPLMEFGPDGEFVKAWDVGTVVKAHGLYIDTENNIWLVDVENHTVRKFGRDGNLLLALGTPGEPGEDASHFNQPTDVAVGPGGEIYISDGYVNSRVVKYSAEGNFIASWGKKGKRQGEFNLPHAIAVDSNGRVYVADRGNKRIQVFTSDGAFISEWKNVGTPYGFYMSPDDEFYVTDGGRNRLMKMDLQGNVMEWMGHAGSGPGQFKLPHDVCVTPDGDIFVSEITNHRVQKFTRNE